LVNEQAGIETDGWRRVSTLLRGGQRLPIR